MSISSDTGCTSNESHGYCSWTNTFFFPPNTTPTPNPPYTPLRGLHVRVFVCIRV